MTVKNEDSDFDEKTNEKLDQMSDFMKGPAGAVIVLAFIISAIAGFIMSFF